jgi:MFS family permease
MRNVYVLALAQALSAAGMMTVFLLGGILGSQFAPLPQLATLPVSLTVVGLAATAIPAALLMERIGRRSAFVASAALAALAALVVAWAVTLESFTMLCAATLLLGANLAFQQQHRFAAAESVPPGRVSTAVSIVMIGTLAAAAVGPQIALALKDLVPGHEYAGSFVGVSVLLAAAALVLTRSSPGLPHEQHRTGHDATHESRPLAAVVRQPLFLVAVAAAVVSYAVMSFIMTATPISMHVHDHHSDTDTAWVIQSHLLAMYGPSLFSGRLIARIGVRTGMAAGLVLMIACVAIDSAGRDLMHYWWGLVLLGIGWNLLFVAGTALLTTTYRPAERFRAQAVNEFSVFGTQALASLLAGPAIHALGWRTLNLAALVPLALFAAALVIWPGQRSKNSRA